ncbi:30S ribosomal protein S17 [Candidatus Pacearchaeota archaeon]|nr:30S ribosomal protein S17 [Candidatus Pacearchaeota archaeon]
MIDKETKEKYAKEKCTDKICPIHGSISLRGRSFKGTIIKKFPKRVVISFDRTLFVEKYERYAKRKTKLHARLPECMFKDVHVGDYIEIMETRPISKIINFVVTKKIQSKDEKVGGKKK